MSSTRFEPAAELVRPAASRRTALVVLLAVEVSTLWLTFPAGPTRQAVHEISVLLGSFGHVRQFLILFAAGTVFFGWTAIRSELRTFENEPQSPAALTTHFIALVLFAALGLSGGPFPVAFAASGALFLLSWLFCVLPPRFWLGWFRSNPGALAAGACVGLAGSFAAAAAGHWRLLSYWTLRIVERLLPLFGQSVVSDPATLEVGTPRFRLVLTGACSGIEGIGLVSVFLIAYLWGCRRDLRFPAAFLLVPIGIVTVWLANALRVTAMILIGGINRAVATEGFHSMAGWLSLNFVALGLVLVSRRARVFTRIDADDEPLDANPAGAYLLPLFSILLVAFITRLAFDGIDRLYPLRVVAGGAVLFAFRSELGRFQWRPSWWAMSIGVLTFISWMGIVYLQGGIHGDRAFENGLARLSAGAAAIWLIFRVIGAIATVPLAEELAFRGYVLRKLISSDFRSVAFDRFTWLSFLGSSVLFGILHGRWIAGVVAGMLFALAARRRGRFSDAVCAHAVANALIAVVVLTTKSWSLWM